MGFKTATLILVVSLCLIGSLSKTKRKFSGDEGLLELILQQRDELQIQKRSSQVPVKQFCNIPEDANIVTVDNNVTIPVDPNWQQPNCNPLSIPVRIDAPSHLSIFPIFVTLKRCLGGCYSILQQCAVTRREKVIVKYNDLMAYQNAMENENYNSSLWERDAIMYNHIECAANCIAKPQDCNPNESFQNCHCNCNINENHCNSTWQTFNSNKCNCDCKNVIQCRSDQEWNPTTCQCECAKCIQDICKKAGLGLDQEHCRCI